MRLVIGLIAGGIGVALLWLLSSWFKGKAPPEKPERPELTLTEDIKKEIRDEIHSDSDAALVKRILHKLGRGKS